MAFRHATAAVSASFASDGLQLTKETLRDLLQDRSAHDRGSLYEHFLNSADNATQRTAVTNCLQGDSRVRCLLLLTLT